MGIDKEGQTHMGRRALLTDREREVLRGDADDVENPEQYRSKIKSRVANRLDRLESDMALLDDAAPQIADDARERICPASEPLETRVERLEARLEGDDGGDSG
jgi:hypothetical protein